MRQNVKPTQEPVPSSNIKDLFFNSGLLDIWATSLEHKYIDRFGNCHLTAAGMEWLFKELVETFKVDMNTAIVAAGYITIDSFQQGADLPNNELTQRNHILRDETTGEYYRWDGDLPKQVPAGSTPQSTGGIGKGAWVSVGDASLRSQITLGSGADLIGGGRLTQYKQHGEFKDGGVVTNRYQGMKHSDGFFYIKTGGEIPYSVLPGETPDDDWSCVGLLNEFPVYSPENFGYKDGDDAVFSFQKAFDAMPYGGDFQLVAGSVYTFKSSAAYIKKTGNYIGKGTFHHSALYSHHAQIINATNGPIFVIQQAYDIPGSKAYADQNRVIDGFKVSGDKVLYPKSGFLTGQATQNTNKVRNNHMRNMGYGICPLTCYGMIIESNVILSCSDGIVSNPAKVAPMGSADPLQNGKKLWQTNAITIRNNYISSDTGYGIDFNCPGNSLVIDNNVIEGNYIAIQVSSMVGFELGDDGSMLRSVSIQDNYIEASKFAHIILGRLDSTTGITGSGARNVTCKRNQMNNDGIPSANAPVILYAVTDASINNSFRNRATSNIMYQLSDECEEVKLSLDKNEVTTGFFSTNKGNVIDISSISTIRPSGISTLHINPDHVDSIPDSEVFQWWSGVSNKPFKSIAGAYAFIDAMKNIFEKNNITNITLKCTGNVGKIVNQPSNISIVNIEVQSGNPVISGMNVIGGNIFISGAFVFSNEDKSTTTPWLLLNGKACIRGGKFDFSSYPHGTYLFYANTMSMASISGVSAVSQLPVCSDGSIVIMVSGELTGSHVKTRGGQIMQ